MWKVKNHILYSGLIFRYVLIQRFKFLSIFASYKSRLDLEMKTILRRYFIKQQNHDPRSKKAPIRYFFFFFFLGSIWSIVDPLMLLDKVLSIKSEESYVAIFRSCLVILVSHWGPIKAHVKLMKIVRFWLLNNNFFAVKDVATKILWGLAKNGRSQLTMQKIFYSFLIEKTHKKLATQLWWRKTDSCQKMQ